VGGRLFAEQAIFSFELGYALERSSVGEGVGLLVVIKAADSESFSPAAADVSRTFLAAAAALVAVVSQPALAVLPTADPASVSLSPVEMRPASMLLVIRSAPALRSSHTVLYHGFFRPRPASAPDSPPAPAARRAAGAVSSRTAR